MKVFRGELESACLSIHLSVCQSVYVQNTNICQRAGGGIKSHLVTALVCITFKFYHLQLFYYSFSCRGAVHNIKTLPYFDLVFKLVKTMLEHYSVSR